MKTAIESIQARGYVRPEKLVDTDWLADHLNDPQVCLIESNEDPLLYTLGHIPGAFEVDWTSDLNDKITRDYIQQEPFQTLMRRLGADEKTTIIFYGDKNNWWATYALWVFELFGITNTRILDGGRLKWEQEKRPMVRDVPVSQTSHFTAMARNDTQARAFKDEVLSHLQAGGKLVDVRSPKEFSGEILHMEGYPNEGALRGGHIPTAKNVPWARAINPEDGTFRSASDLRAIYENEAGLNSSDEVIAYCRIGERSSHTWFVLKYLLGYNSVRNYDGSWTEWGNSVKVPIETGP